MNEIKEILDIKEFSDIVSEIEATLPRVKWTTPKTVPNKLNLGVQGCINKRYILSKLAVSNGQPPINAFPSVVGESMKESDHEWIRNLYQEVLNVEPLGDDYLLFLVIIEEVSRFGSRQLDASRHMDIIPTIYFDYLNGVRKKLDTVLERFINAKEVIVKPEVKFDDISVSPDLFVDGSFITLLSSQWTQFGKDRISNLKLIDTFNHLSFGGFDNGSSKLINIYTNDSEIVKHDDRERWVNYVKGKLSDDIKISTNIKKELVEKREKQKVNIRISLKPIKKP